MKRPFDVALVNAFFFAAIAALAISIAARPAAAGSFEVTPIRVELAPGQSTTTINLRNLASEPAAVQVRAFNWTQTSDKDDLAPTQDIVLSPPIFTIPAGQVQTVRLLMRARDVRPDHPWRLLFDEVPQPGKPGEIAMAMRLSVPVLVEAPNGPKPTLT